MSTFGEMLRQFRLRSGLSQSELALRANLSPRSISDIERGVRSRAYIPTVEALSGSLGLSDDEKLCFSAAVQRARRSSAGIIEVLRPRNVFDDRRREFAFMVETLAEPGALVAVIGPAAVGKTRLVREVSREMNRRFQAEVVYLGLELQSERAKVVELVNQALERPGEENRRPGLLILDNLEHLLPLSDEIATILARFSGLSILIASRVPTANPCEIEIALQPAA